MHRYGVLLVLLALAACRGRGGAETLEIAVIPKGTTHEFWRAVHAGARKAEAELRGEGIPVRVFWKGPPKEDDREQQVTVLEDFVVRGVDGIVLAPLDETALVRPVAEAFRAGIPVLIIDSALKGQQVSFVATENTRGGELAALHLVRLLGEEGTVIVLRYQEGSASTTNRERGFLATLRRFPRVRVLAAHQYGGPTTESAYKRAETLLQRFPTVDGIFCPNESTTFGMLRALQDAGRAGRVKFVGFDASPKLVAALRRREIHGLVLQDPFRMGYEGVRLLVRHLRGGRVPRRVDTGAVVATPENLDDPEVKRRLFPPLRRWLKE